MAGRADWRAEEGVSAPVGPCSWRVRLSGWGGGGGGFYFVKRRLLLCNENFSILLESS